MEMVPTKSFAGVVPITSRAPMEGVSQQSWNATVPTTAETTRTRCDVSARTPSSNAPTAPVSTSPPGATGSMIAGTFLTR